MWRTVSESEWKCGFESCFNHYNVAGFASKSLQIQIFATLVNSQLWFSSCQSWSLILLYFNKNFLRQAPNRSSSTPPPPNKCPPTKQKYITGTPLPSSVTFFNNCRDTRKSCFYYHFSDNPVCKSYKIMGLRYTWLPKGELKCPSSDKGTSF